MSFTEQLQSEILELVNCISDNPIISLIDDNAFEPLISLLHSSQFDTDPKTDETYRFILLDALYHFGNTALDPLLAYIQYEPIGDETDRILGNPVAEHDRTDSRTHATELALKLNYEDTLSMLLEMIEAGVDRYLIKKIAQILIRPNTDEIITTFSRILLEHPDPYIRRVMAEVFGEHSDTNVIMPLTLSIKDSIAFVAKAAINALAAFKVPEVMPHLIEALSDFRYIEVRTVNQSHVALAAIEAIHAYQTDEANKITFEFCINNIYHEQKEIRRFVIRRLGNLQDNRAIPYITDALDYYRNDPFYFFDYEARIALEEIGTPEALDAIDQWRNGS